ncbi:TPA: hypothetical protein DCG86_02880 [Candidatus Marinimicrobia bacterium]|nr:MAG: Putative metal-binding/nucleic-acid-binding protein [Marinimicrobia bacterium 46_47]KUK90757.1 MAG: Putative metal-binding/nucleic-acid-binding protein [Marinimicrobia bacterium 46_43]HAE86950.1 hypothetical protein [Candidatus Neomarinimicrobiota bacterium]HBY17582.1 hypothetical protein [Candidatus Neomarinimicrobiota bacterium]
MEILLSHVSDEEKLFEFDERSADIGLPDQFGRVSTSIHIYSLGQKYFAWGTLEVDVRLTCDICLDEYERHFVEHFEVVADSGPEPEVPDEEEVIYISPKALSIDFSDFARDQLLLALPIQKRCRPDCKGLCPVCGANLNRETCSHETGRPDSRWDKLRALKMKIENSEN